MTTTNCTTSNGRLIFRRQKQFQKHKKCTHENFPNRNNAKLRYRVLNVVLGYVTKSVVLSMSILSMIMLCLMSVIGLFNLEFHRAHPNLNYFTWIHFIIAFQYLILSYFTILLCY